MTGVTTWYGFSPTAADSLGKGPSSAGLHSELPQRKLIRKGNSTTVLIVVCKVLENRKGKTEGQRWCRIVTRCSFVNGVWYFRRCKM